MFGLLPPSSSEIFFTLPAASRMISWPVVVSPVNATLPMPGWAAIDAPAVPPGPVTTLRTPGGMPGLERELAEPDRGQRRVRRGLQDRGVAGGERRRDLPVAISSGKFHGTISPTTPIGSRSVRSRPGFDTGIVWPKILLAAPA